MFNKNSDYAQNKRADAIIYIGAAGSPVILTRADFSGEDEFQIWKLWSDRDYRLSEKQGRSFYDNCIPLDESLDGGTATASAEDDFISKLDEPERLRARAERSKQIKETLTEKQFRCLWMYFVDGKNLGTIAHSEKVAHQNISKAITGAKKKLEQFLRR